MGPAATVLTEQDRQISDGSWSVIPLAILRPGASHTVCR